MAAQLIWTNEAVNWLQKIYRYIAADNPVAAKHTIDGIRVKARLLKAQPRIGYLYTSNDEDEIRILLYGHYRIAYRLSPEEASPSNILFWAFFMAHFTILASIWIEYVCSPPDSR